MSPTVSGAPAKWPDYSDYVEALRKDDAQLADEFAAFHGIKDVLDWARDHELLGRESIDIIGQDEFHYDFLIALEPNGRWLAFGVT